jgi:hypothetical protein
MTEVPQRQTVADLVLSQVRPTPPPPPPRLPGPLDPASAPITVNIGIPGLFGASIPIVSKPRLALAGGAVAVVGLVGGAGIATVLHFLKGGKR